MPVLAERLDEEQLLADARALRAQWSELQVVLEELDAAAGLPPTAGDELYAERLGGEARPQAAGPA